MAPIKFKVVNDRKIAKELEERGPTLVGAMEGVIKRAVLRVSGRMVKTIQRGSRSGIDYPRPGGAVHKASAPGEPPKSDTGFLASHIAPTKTTVRGVVVSADVVVSTEYAGLLEKGTSRMKARPFAEPSFELELPAIRRDAKQALRKAIR